MNLPRSAEAFKKKMKFSEICTTRIINMKNKTKYIELEVNICINVKIYMQIFICIDVYINLIDVLLVFMSNVMKSKQALTLILHLSAFVHV